MEYPPDIGPHGGLSGDRGRSPRMEGAWDRKAGRSGGHLGRCWGSPGEAGTTQHVLVLPPPCGASHPPWTGLSRASQSAIPSPYLFAPASFDTGPLPCHCAGATRPCPLPGGRPGFLSMVLDWPHAPEQACALARTQGQGLHTNVPHVGGFG